MKTRNDARALGLCAPCDGYGIWPMLVSVLRQTPHTRTARYLTSVDLVCLCAHKIKKIYKY